MAAPAKANPPHGQPGHVHGDEAGDEGDGAMGDPRQLAAQFDLVQRELQRVDRRLQVLEEALVEAQQAAAALRTMADAEGEQDILLPLGSGVHVAAKVDGAQPVLMPLGAGYFTEDKAANVATALDERVKAIGAQFEEASAQAEQLAQVAAQINERLSQSQP
ncbi:MAG TPA: prefoldin subunit alpha [Candidatus Thermoplasmatota archaeon]|nr:prefoldin subunit alpha [Candidatus Thermoplasmatota archaeon]